MKSDRHATVEVQCETCGNSFMARRERVLKGQGRFCGKECFDVRQREQKSATIWGRKDLAKVYNVGGKYTVRWYDADGNIKSTTYARWWWEMNVGEIPDGMIILHKDGNPLNISPDNFEIGEKSEALRRGNITRRGYVKSWSHYVELLRVKSTGRKMSQDSRDKMSKSRTGNPKVSGENNARWRGGVDKGYPREFYNIRDFVIERDRSKCQVCSRNLVSRQHVHHRDGNRENNEQDNLLTLCASCHGKVHSSSSESLPIMALRSELHWNR